MVYVSLDAGETFFWGCEAVLAGLLAFCALHVCVVLDVAVWAVLMAYVLENEALITRNTSVDVILAFRTRILTFITKLKLSLYSFKITNGTLHNTNIIMKIP